MRNIQKKGKVFLKTGGIRKKEAMQAAGRVYGRIAVFTICFIFILSNLVTAAA